MECWLGTAPPPPYSRHALPRDLVSVQLWQTDCKRCGRGKQNQLRIKALREKQMINVPSVYGPLQSVTVGNEWKRIPHRSKVQSELWLFVFVCVFVS